MNSYENTLNIILEMIQDLRSYSLNSDPENENSEQIAKIAKQAIFNIGDIAHKLENDIKESDIEKTDLLIDNALNNCQMLHQHALTDISSLLNSNDETDDDIEELFDDDSEVKDFLQADVLNNETPVDLFKDNVAEETSTANEEIIINETENKDEETIIETANNEEKTETVPKQKPKRKQRSRQSDLLSKTRELAKKIDYTKIIDDDKINKVRNTAKKIKNTTLQKIEKIDTTRALDSIKLSGLTAASKTLDALKEILEDKEN